MIVRRPLLALGLALLAASASLEAQPACRGARSGQPNRPTAAARGPVAAIGARGTNPSGPFATVNLMRPIDPTGRDSILALSRSLLGVRYRWAGSNENGVDCSGLVRYVFGALGIDLPHNAAQLSKRGTSVPADTAQMQPGDLIVFSPKKSNRISHVGIYMGNGTMLHASSFNKRVVEVPLATYRSLRLRDVRRVVAVTTPAASEIDG
ncbi:MAG: C40 family peptidase [Gemmatimonadaceae bacterium]